MATKRFSPPQLEFLSRMSSYIWWKTRDEAMEYPQRILAQLMDMGTLEDTRELEKLFSPDELMEVLNEAEAGQFRPRSWSFWHCRITGEEAPAMPVRKLP